MGRTDKLDGLHTTEFVVGSVDQVGFGLFIRIGKAFAEGVNIDHHDLNVIIGGKAANLVRLLRIVDKVIVLNVVVLLFKVLLGNLQRLVHPFLNGHRWHHNNKLGEAIALVQLKG